MRRESRVPMSLFTYFLDGSIQNAYRLLQSVVVPGEMTVLLRNLSEDFLINDVNSMI